MTEMTGHPRHDRMLSGRDRAMRTGRHTCIQLIRLICDDVQFQESVTISVSSYKILVYPTIHQQSLLSNYRKVH